MIRVISYAICPFVQRVTALLEAKGLDYAIDYISLSDKPDWFLEISPTGQVPLLVTAQGEVLFESDAIVEYLDEVTVPLVEGLSPVQRARERAWSYQASKHYLTQCSIMQSGTRDIFIERVGRLNSAFERAEKQLSGSPFFNGDHLGNVDIAWLPLLHRAWLIEKYGDYDLLADSPRVKAWQKSIIETGLPDKTVSADFEQRFVGFYLSEKTFLGRGADFDEVLATDNSTPDGGGCG